MEKVCRKCKEEKEYIFFGKDNSSKDGHQPVCRECRSIYYNQNKSNIKKKKGSL